VSERHTKQSEQDDATHAHIVASGGSDLCSSRVLSAADGPLSGGLAIAGEGAVKSDRGASERTSDSGRPALCAVDFRRCHSQFVWQPTAPAPRPEKRDCHARRGHQYSLFARVAVGADGESRTHDGGGDESDCNGCVSGCYDKDSSHCVYYMIVSLTLLALDLICRHAKAV